MNRPQASAPRHLALVIHSLEGGGAERVLAGMANHWADRGDRVSLITLAGEGLDRYPLNDSVTRIGLDALRVSSNPIRAVVNNVRRVRKLRKAIRDSGAQTVISFTATMNVLTLLAVRRLDVQTVICERVDPRHHAIGRAWSCLRRHLYPRCSAAVVQTRDVCPFVQSLVKGKPVYIIPNAVEPPVPATSIPATSLRPAAPRRPRIVAIGRLDRQKGFDLLIEAFRSVASKHPDWELYILGEGSELERLERQAAPLGNHVQFEGWQPNPGEYLQQAAVFVLSSRYEGFPNALLEAMACGSAVVSFDCPSGPREIIRPDEDGLLVPPEDVAGLAAALDQLMSDESRRQVLGRRARQIVERFSPNSYYDRWEAVLRGEEPAVVHGDASPCGREAS